MRLSPAGARQPARALLTALIVTLAVVVFAGPAGAAKPSSYPLHAGSHGRKVSDLQWLLAGHRPNVFTKTKPTFHWKTNGWYGARTKSAVKAFKFRIGYPAKGQCGATRTSVTDTANRYFISLLEGKKHRPTCWVAVAAKRIAGTVVAGATKTALAIKTLELSQLGVHEVPDGSNRGPRISFAQGGFGPYQGSTGAYGEAWCASFATWALERVTGHTFGSANNAYVPTIAEYAQARGWLQAKPRVGSFVIFLSSDRQLVNAFHIGYVIKLVGSSGVMTVEGNYANAVHEVYRTFDSNPMVYVDVPGIA